MADFPTGAILALHKNRSERQGFVVLKRVYPVWPRIDLDKEIKEHEKTGGYDKVWFQPFDIPDMDVSGYKK